jgi:hypothetical protein
LISWRFIDFHIFFDDDKIILVVANNLFAAVKDDANTIVEDVSKGVLDFFEFVL